MSARKSTVQISFPEGVPVEMAVSDGPGDRVEIKAGTLRLVLGMNEPACANLAAFFARAAERRKEGEPRPRAARKGTPAEATRKRAKK